MIDEDAIFRNTALELATKYLVSAEAMEAFLRQHFHVVALTIEQVLPGQIQLEVPCLVENEKHQQAFMRSRQDIECKRRQQRGGKYKAF